MRRPGRPDGTALPASRLHRPAVRCYRRSPRLGPSLKRHRTQPDAPGLRAPSFWRRCQPAVVRPGTGRFRGGPANPQSNTAGRHLLADGTFVFPQWDRLMRGQLRGAGLAGSPDRVSRPSDTAAPCRLTRHVAAGNAVTERSTARRPNSLPLIGAEPLAGGVGVCSAGPHSRFSATSWNWRVRVAVDVGSSESDTKPGPPVFAPLRSSSWPCRAKSLSYRSQARPSLSRSIRR